MAAWYILSAMGFYPICPGKPEYTLGSPLFSHAAIHLGHGKDIVIDAPGNGQQTPYVGRIMVNESLHRTNVIDHSTLAQGARIRFEMRNTPTSA